MLISKFDFLIFKLRKNVLGRREKSKEGFRERASIFEGGWENLKILKNLFLLENSICLM